MYSERQNPIKRASRSEVRKRPAAVSSVECLKLERGVSAQVYIQKYVKGRLELPDIDAKVSLTVNLSSFKPRQNAMVS